MTDDELKVPATEMCDANMSESEAKVTSDLMLKGESVSESDGCESEWDERMGPSDDETTATLM